MKLIYTLLFSSFIFISHAETAELNCEVLPPDSTSSIIDRTTSLYFLEEGKKEFSRGKTRDALRRFREAYVRDQYSSKAAYWIGESHYKMDNFGYALKYARIAEGLTSGVDGDLLYLMGKSYHRQNNIDSAAMNYVKAQGLLSNAKNKVYNIDGLLDELKFADSVSKLESLFERNLLNDKVNSGYDDYNMVISNDGKEAFFVSRRPDTKGGNVNPDDQRYFEDIYYSKWNDTTNNWGNSTNDLGRLNTEGFDAISHIVADGSEVYLTVNTSVADVRNQTRSSDICVAKKSKEDRWNSPRAIQNKSINTSFFDGAPTLTQDGNTMYFMSDRDGERSQSDIYVVYKVGRDWGTAQKLPMTVNTKNNETTPFITPDGRFLFFSSEGHKGMGGYDIYVTENKGNEWTKPINLGADFNTVNDDLFFKYYEQLKKAVVSTYRIQGDKSSLDIYEIIIENWRIPTSK
ncbi:hypothetical protein ERX46_14365 [Brumimicrobium glaciale]|uniref:Uncharacterized protein n=1 Tax=Brumimicrobium glaciale TaxID=200475 RepID=A0A4Q4KJL0_9FLAO|nr:PD40 domain-containing protein [Brumimicrobium glaciale]RYM32454.1 hypothetical protein ERX46_14365 [Brumimicrobium glaciale]